MTTPNIPAAAIEAGVEALSSRGVHCHQNEISRAVLTAAWEHLPLANVLRGGLSDQVAEASQDAINAILKLTDMAEVGGSPHSVVTTAEAVLARVQDVVNRQDDFLYPRAVLDQILEALSAYAEDRPETLVTLADFGGKK